MPSRTLSPFTAVLIGTAVVNVPVLLLIFGPSILAMAAGFGRYVPLLFLASPLVAWIWWSVSVPRWRLWAYERVPSTGRLQTMALAAGLVWPRGFFIEKTEIKSAAHRQREQELEREFP